VHWQLSTYIKFVKAGAFTVVHMHDVCESRCIDSCPHALEL